MRITAGFILTFVVVCGIIFSVLKVPVEHQNGGGCFPYGNADSFCLPERGGDADVRYMGIAVSVRRTYNFDINIHRQS